MKTSVQRVGTAGSTLLLPLLVLALLLLPANPAWSGDDSKEKITPPQPIKKSQRPPVFPPAAKAGRFTGEVVVGLTVLPTGEPDRVLVLHCSHPKIGFEEAAVEAVEHWRFIPAMKNGVPIPFEAQYRLTFGRHGVGVAGGADVSAMGRRVDAANRNGQAPQVRPSSYGGTQGSRTSPRRR